MLTDKEVYVRLRELMRLHEKMEHDVLKIMYHPDATAEHVMEARRMLLASREAMVDSTAAVMKARPRLAYSTLMPVTMPRFPVLGR